jgi:hypothetical protein
MNTTVAHTMANSDTLTTEFCTILGLKAMFGDLVNCV